MHTFKVHLFFGDFMYRLLAKKTTDFFIKKKIIKNTDKDVYEYGYEILFAQIIYIAIMIVISLIFNAFVESLFFFIGFYIYRKISGGYHAETYAKCHLLFGFNQILFLLLLFYIPVIYRYIIFFIIIFISIIITFFMAPIDHPNKQFDSKEYHKYKKMSRLLAFLLIPFGITVYLLDKNNTFCFGIGIFSASVSLLYAFLERRFHNEKV